MPDSPSIRRLFPTKLGANSLEKGILPHAPSSPRSSPYDLRFTLLGFEVRVSWTFWMVAAALGYAWAKSVNNYLVAVQNNPPGAFVILLIWMAAMFVSILVHELGHAIAFRYYGIPSHIVLYHFGGLAIPARFDSWQGARMKPVTAQNQLIISLAGPGAQILLGVLVGVLALFLRVNPDPTFTSWLERIGIPLAFDDLPPPSNGLVMAFLEALISPSIYWALINLVPIFPLDGGQVLRSLCAMFRRTDGYTEAYLAGAIFGGIFGLCSCRVVNPCLE